MPTLTTEENPPALAINGLPAAHLPKERRDKSWYVACIRSRQEKQAARILLTQKTSYYLPMEEYLARAANRYLTTQRILFPGYLFVFASPNSCIFHALRKQAFSYLPVLDEWLLRAQLRALLLASRHLPFAQLNELLPGRRVEFLEGPLQGVQTTILSRSSGQGIAQIDIPMLGAASFLVDLEKWPLKLVQPSHGNAHS